MDRSGRGTRALVAAAAGAGATAASFALGIPGQGQFVVVTWLAGALAAGAFAGAPGWLAGILGIGAALAIAAALAGSGGLLVLVFAILTGLFSHEIGRAHV